MASPPPTAKKTARELAEERSKLDQLRTYYKRLVKERNDLKEKLEATASTKGAPGTPSAKREARLRDDYEALRRENMNCVAKLRAAERAAEEASTVPASEEAAPVRNAMKPIVEQLCATRPGAGRGTENAFEMRGLSGVLLNSSANFLARFGRSSRRGRGRGRGRGAAAAAARIVRSSSRRDRQGTRHVDEVFRNQRGHEDFAQQATTVASRRTSRRCSRARSRARASSRRGRRTAGAASTRPRARCGGARTGGGRGRRRP